MNASGRVPNVLLATSRDWLAASIEGVLDHGKLHLARVESPDELRTSVRESVPDAVLLDQDLAGTETPEICDWLVEEWLGERVPLIVYSSNLRDEDLHARIVESGAWTVIQEPIRSRYLVATVQRLLEIGGAGRNSRAARNGRSRVAELPSLAEVIARLPVLEALAERNKTSISLLAVGPQQPAAGELMERQRRRTAQLCLSVARGSDLCGWLDDGDVVIVAYGASRGGARKLADRLAEQAAQWSEVEHPEEVLSMGIVDFRPGEDTETVRATGRANGESELIEKARQALDRARSAGGGIEFGS